MQTVELASKKRDVSTKGALTSLRAEGRVPAVVYGGGKPPTVASVDAKELLKLLKAHGRNAVVSLKVEGGEEIALIQEIQRDIISHQPIHADFRRVSATDKLEVSVPLVVKGEAPGVKTQGGILEHMLHDIRVRCLVSEIPSHFDVDVSKLAINTGIRVKELPLPKDMEVLTDLERLVVNIVAPSELKEEVPAAGAAVAGAAEPEVIAKGKKPEEGAEGAEAKPGDAKAGAAGAKPGDAKAAAPAAKEGAKK
jgi:large subunit ribosomal protein L25